MFSTVQKAGFTSESNFLAVVITSFVCSVYCLFLLFVTWRNLWTEPRQKVESQSIIKRELRLATAVEIEEANRSASMSAIRKEKSEASTIDRRIKWIVTLCVLSNYLICIGGTCERLLYLIAPFSGKGCLGTLYVSYLRVFADGFFFNFYLIRATILLEKSVYQIPKIQQYFLGIAPMLTYGGLFVAFNLRLQVYKCAFADLVSIILIALFSICHLFWNITLLCFLVYHIQQVLFTNNN
ncbi:hypothetical protein RFI_27176 [Reticulomyxa filosa]|uniref:Uncharacterized protein n=1 Tax=Reticulomyxa filosa TaxID=46433 RepID=X6MAY5_RETFI|nr:hypothetical protein RFI_27176 [Reticulomyxa filosa]|eukprot:ETO10200.1 hypothetical protein RFI_27176 [Reticulomyxa filosa]